MAERKLRDSPHVTDEILQSQLLNALSEEARDTVSALPAGSFDKAMENYEELRQVEKDHREMMDQFLSSIQELEGKMVVGREEAAGLTSCHG